MLKAKTEKTASAPKARLLLGVALVLLGSGLLMFGFRGATKDRVFIKTPQQLVQAEVLDDDIERQKGLSGRDGIGPNAAVLFIFDQDGYHGIWMKDMRFAIDIVWTDAGKKVIYVKENTDPDTYPQVFTPARPAKYVIELNAGRASSLGITENTQLTW